MDKFQQTLITFFILMFMQLITFKFINFVWVEVYDWYLLLWYILPLTFLASLLFADLDN